MLGKSVKIGVCIVLVLIAWVTVSLVYYVDIKAVHSKNLSTGTYCGYVFAPILDIEELIRSKGLWVPSAFAADYNLVPNDNIGPYSVSITAERMVWSPISYYFSDVWHESVPTIAEQYCTDPMIKNYIATMPKSDVLWYYARGKSVVIPKEK